MSRGESNPLRLRGLFAPTADFAKPISGEGHPLPTERATSTQGEGRPLLEQTSVHVPDREPGRRQAAPDSKIESTAGSTPGARRRRPKREIENAEWLAALRRWHRAAVKRVGEGDVEDLAVLLDILKDFDGAVREAVHLMREHGASWSDIARAAGTTRQSAWERWS